MAVRDGDKTDWVPAVRRADGPLYLAIADALAADIQAGRLVAGTRLPPQRALADVLGIDFTTVSRAYAEAQRRGLVEGRVGQGTFVLAKRQASSVSASSGIIDMSMNLPPRFDDLALVDRMTDDMAAAQAEGGLDLLLRYQEAGGAGRDRAAGAAWLAPRIADLAVERVLVAPGAQGALLAVAGLLAAPGETIAAEALTYPGFRALAARLGIRLAGVALDREGMIPEAFEAVCRDQRPKALYSNPTLHNPTTSTLSLERREAIVAIARRHGVSILEDDAYGALPVAPVPPFAALAPELTYHVAGLAKCLSPALRIAYLVVPDARTALRAAAALRATAAMASPLSAAIATRWIEASTAAAVLAAIRAESGARMALAASILPPDHVVADPEGFHVWLPLPEPWTRGEFTARLHAARVGVVASDAFALSNPPEAIRLGLGASADREALRQGLLMLADLMAQPPALSSMVV